VLKDERLQDLNQENESTLDDQLFVGDVEGLRKLKTEMKKSLSQAGSVQILVSGIREARERLREKALEAEQREKAEVEERELYTAEELDDPDVQLAIALSLEQEGRVGSYSIAFVVH
jgi:hypothetical protein